MFATLNLERDPLKLAEVPRELGSWVQDAGGFCLVLLLVMMIWARARWPGGLSNWLWGAPDPERPRSWAPALFKLCLVAAVVGYVVAGLMRLLDHILSESPDVPTAPSVAKGPTVLVRGSGWVLTFAAACALLAVCLPFFVSLLSLRWRRIWGIARLSFKEAVRRKVLWVFASVLLIFLFLSWFVPAKRENQLQTYVTVVFLYLTPVLLVSSALIAAFGIPTDIKQQTIHTVVTKPVERFELVLGRFLGYTLLMSAVLLVLTTLCLGYVLRGINPDAAAESLKARDPLYGELHFQKIAGAYTDREAIEEVKREDRELNVGREWDYHKYVPGVNLEKETGPILQAVWHFDEVPGVLARRPRVRCEYKFDIYRQTKGKEGEAVRCSFFLHTRYFNPAGNDRTDYYNARKTLLNLQRPGDDPQRRAQAKEVIKVLPGASDEAVSRLSAGEGKPNEIDGSSTTTRCTSTCPAGCSATLGMVRPAGARHRRAPRC
ncbi:MAG: ABC transporter permease [Planctomycetes bacterium]|nr:ABC transporter permease [Planctomycetota bacterium]